jgi:hypothetical protein
MILKDESEFHRCVLLGLLASLIRHSVEVLVLVRVFSGA